MMNLLATITLMVQLCKKDMLSVPGSRNCHLGLGSMALFIHWTHGAIMKIPEHVGEVRCFNGSVVQVVNGSMELWEK